MREMRGADDDGRRTTMTNTDGPRTTRFVEDSLSEWYWEWAHLGGVLVVGGKERGCGAFDLGMRGVWG